MAGKGQYPVKKSSLKSITKKKIRNGKWSCDCGTIHSLPGWVDESDAGDVVHECPCGRTHLMGAKVMTYIGRFFFDGNQYV
jgi:hypothetical protein